ncbi:MAG: bifunctional hydroxymethylpyrimidine kinase/phosphomethylpyrimidine kinase [Methanobacterium sp. ERen5]|nr:MAG: bifunctional hydroxymethylpyrimidine kinase/phosphomethylpyrimidine kinase [Methanobacterium sp. ERen5]
MIALSIAGYDPSGGAGILNDVKTFQAMGIYGTGVITVLTAQNPESVEAIEPVSTEFIEKQLETLLKVYPIQYCKTGMLYNKENLKLVGAKTKEHNLKMVVDPVIVAGCGAELSVDGYAKELKKYLLPNATLTTPNIYEAELISGQKIESVDDAVEAAVNIGKICDVVITGGNLNGSNIVFDGTLSVVENELIGDVEVHGTGCSFSAAVTVGLLKNNCLKRSVEDAVEFVKHGVEHGKWGTLDQFHSKRSY